MDGISEHAKRMLSLKARLQALRELVPLDRPVVYLDYPVHLNIGDLLINLGTEAWLGSAGYEIACRASVFDFGRSDAGKVSPDSSIVLHGGGNFGDLYPIHQEFRERIVEQFPRNRIVIMPQSVHFNNPARLAEAARCFAAHRNLTITVRDLDSERLVREYFSNPVHLVPDMAHQLWPVQRSAHGTGETLTLLRTDIERTPMDAAGSASLVDPQDWATLLTARDHLIHKFVKRWYELDQRVGHRFPNHRLWYFVRDRLVNRMLRLFGDAERIMTNRLHGVILGCLVERPVSYFDNSYGKLSRYCSTWLEGCLVNRM